MATFLMVHGAFQGGWVWQKVSTILQQQGHIVHTPTLTGCGYLYSENQHATDLSTYIGDIGRYMDFEDLNNIFLVGHSFSGMICGALMMQYSGRISRAIFVDAVIPESDRSFVAIAGEQFQQMLDHHRLENDRVKPWPAKVFGISGDGASWFESRLRPFPYQPFYSDFPATFDATLRPVSFITCRQTMSPFIREMATKAKELSWPIDELDTGHCPMITCPEALADLLSTIAS
jgi:pimeloyl-ACP methyl ester carboxylesterase